MYNDEPQMTHGAVWDAPVEQRAQFIWNTYLHLFAAVITFVLLEIALFQSGMAAKIAAPMLNAWWAVLGAFVLIGWGATHFAHTAVSKSAQYGALALYVVLEAAIFCPILYIANRFAPGAIESAAQITILGFSLLTAIVFVTRKDFSFLRGLMIWGGAAALLAIVSAMMFGFELGTWFSVAMVVFAGAAILYDTSNILHHYPEDRYVAASLSLFASLALMFWYVLRLVMAMQSDD